jgi:hypothetical protein
MSHSALNENGDWIIWKTSVGAPIVFSTTMSDPNETAIIPAPMLAKLWDPRKKAAFMIDELRCAMDRGRREVMCCTGVLHPDVQAVLREAGYIVKNMARETDKVYSYVSLPESNE